MIMQPETGKLSVKEKIGYSLGDGAAATLFLIARLWGAVCDPVFGALADRTNTRWGKFRPWILWTALPFGVLGYLAFKTPELSASGKLLYAYITYFLLLTIYSANNNPY